MAIEIKEYEGFKPTVKPTEKKSPKKEANKPNDKK